MITNLFHQFEGCWSFERILQLQKTHQFIGTASGKATFTPHTEKDTFHYLEQGIYAPAHGNIIHTTAEYFYVYDPALQTISVFFNASKKITLFHSLHFDESYHNASGEHQCSQDHYHIHYHFFNLIHPIFNTFQIIYTVTGPTKFYISQTTFKREYVRGAL